MQKPKLSSLSTEFRTTRSELGLTQTQLAAETQYHPRHLKLPSVSLRTLADIERGAAQNPGYLTVDSLRAAAERFRAGTAHITPGHRRRSSSRTQTEPQAPDAPRAAA